MVVKVRLHSFQADGGPVSDGGAFFHFCETRQKLL
jgi:hypothetical protein